MTEKEAVRILIRHAARDCTGAGCGVRTIPDREERLKVAEAVVKSWPEKYPISTDDLFNLGLPIPT
jgi:hypothetical protein